jgi:DNA-binding MarR family transcriptional regulator
MAAKRSMAAAGGSAKITRWPVGFNIPTWHAACWCVGMTGGRHQRWKVEIHHPYYPPNPKPRLPDEIRADDALERWTQAAAFRRRVNRALKKHGLTLSGWRMLHAAARLVEEAGDMVSQLDISRRARIDQNTVSVLTFRLADKGWLSWGPDCYDFGYRIFVTEEGQALLDATRGQVLAAAAQTWGPSLRGGA